jgi:hypothetical protein
MSIIKEKCKSSDPGGKDELRQVTVVREKWVEYRTTEKRFSKEFADALIGLHQRLAKPGHGTFGECLKELKIPHTTAYRLMELHGWKAKKRVTKIYTLEEHQLERYKMLCKEVRAYCAKLRKDSEYKAKLEAFFREVTEGFGITVEIWEAACPS